MQDPLPTQSAAHAAPGIAIAMAIAMAIAAVGFLAGAVILRHPEGLHVPLWIAMAACLSVALSGAALMFQTLGSARSYQWAVVLLLVCMTAVPFGLTFGTERLQCKTTIPIFNGEKSCRIVFGSSAGLALMITLVALQQALRKPLRSAPLHEKA